MREASDDLWFERPTDRVGELLGSEIRDHLERALLIIQRDIDATFPQLGRLQLRWISSDMDDPYIEGDEPYVLVYVALSTSGSYCGAGSSVYAGRSDDEEETTPATFEDMVSSVAACTQELAIELYLRTWPDCPQHNWPFDVSFPEDWPVWHCPRNGGHDVARVGSLTEIIP
ncbi:MULTISPECIES: hypothetical protein [unclassified Frankia]|uniref:hypothetical protein n=1 Tax=unclassified Frankia TaxID=2632575 RepID=UPI0010559C65|nr:MULTISPECIES: hypothetical protein [unclassified Frankia]